MKNLNLLRDNKNEASTAVLAQLNILEAAKQKLTDLQDAEVIAKAAFNGALQEELNGVPEVDTNFVVVHESIIESFDDVVVQDSPDAEQFDYADCTCGNDFDYCEPCVSDMEAAQFEADIKGVQAIKGLKAPKNQALTAQKVPEFNVPQGSARLRALYFRIVAALTVAYPTGINKITVRELISVFECSHLDIYALAGYSEHGNILIKPLASTNVLFTSKYSSKGNIDVRFLPLER